jgi:hypothetical protein
MFQRECGGNLFLAKLIMDKYYPTPRSPEREAWKAKSRQCLDRGRELAVRYGLQDLHCTALCWIGDFQVFFQRAENEAWGYWMKAASLGDEVNDEVVPRNLRMNLARVGMIWILLLAWDALDWLNRVEIVESIAREMGWEPHMVRDYISVIYDGMWISGGTRGILAAAYREDALKPYFEETQRVLFGLIENAEGMIGLSWKIRSTSLNAP